MIDRSAVGGPLRGGAGATIPHDSALKHVSGEALYTDDLPLPAGTLYAAVGMSERAHAEIVGMDLKAVSSAPGVACVVTAGDVPGSNDAGPVLRDEKLLAESMVEFAGQPIFAVAARTVEQARRAARLGTIRYEDREPLLTIDEAMRRDLTVLPMRSLRRGDAAAAVAEAPHRLHGALEMGGQDHFYLEGQVALAVPLEDGDMLVYSSTQHPTDVQRQVARTLGLRANAVAVEVRRMGGGFGGKESQAAGIACIAALLAHHTGAPVLFRLDRDDDMILTGKRHEFRTTYDVGFDDDGRILGVSLEMASRCGFSADLSGPVNDRAMFHADNAYFLEHVTIVSHRLKTNTASNTAFRGFGGPQGMMGIESVMDEIARSLGKDPLDVRKVNLYGATSRNVTPYDQVVEDNILADVIDSLERRADYRARRKAAQDFNASSPILKRGIALTPVKFGISFTATHLNQAGALIHIYTDGSIHLNHGGTEMGQGVMTNVAQLVAEEFQVDMDRIKITPTNTGKVPNTSASAASSTTDMNGAAALDAARTLKQRLTAFVAERYGVTVDEVRFRRNEVLAGTHTIPFTELAVQAHQGRIQLSATGFYRTPKIRYDPKGMKGRPFFYFAYGAAVSEVVVDTLTGEYKVLRVDILHDAGNPINAAIARGQVEGGFIQGLGWLTTEELIWDDQGHLLTHAPSTYKIPACGDLPLDFRVALLERGANREDVVFRSKAVGEPPFMLAISVFHALKDAIASVGDGRSSPPLAAPATPERVLFAIEAIRQAASPPTPAEVP